MRDAPEGELPMVGRRWRDKYDILEQLVAEPAQRVWRGRSIAGGGEVVLRGFAAQDPEHRARAWSKLAGIDSPHLQRAREAFTIGAWRVEVMDSVRGVALSAWRRERATVDSASLRSVVAHLAEALGALHAFELVHLGLRPDRIFVEEDGTSLHCTVAGLESVTAFDDRERVPASVDARYAPPEAAGLHVHVAGPALCAWDWWSLGRLVQELILGESMVRRLNPALKDDGALQAAAETLLAETAPDGTRAGAVERMDALDPAVELLLRGLLTTASESRWTGDNVDRWIRGQPVKEFYAVPRKQTHLKWRGRPYTVHELAATLQSAEHWTEAQSQVFDSATPGTLAHFINTTPTQSAALAQLTSGLELVESLPLKLSTPTAQREAVTMVALMQLSNGRLLWRGREFGLGAVAAMVEQLGETDAVMILRGLTVRSTAMQIERVDATAGRALTELGRTAGDAEAVLKRYSWLSPNDPAGAARVFQLSVEPLATLRATRDELSKRYAGSDHPAMAKIFKAQNLGRSDLVILAWAASAPEHFKFYTHEEADRRRAEALRTRGGELVATLAWTRFEDALQRGRIVFGDWGWFLATWFVVGAPFALLWPGPIGLGVAAGPAVAALLVRLVLGARHRRLLSAVVPQSAWAWQDGPARCRREFRLAGAGVRRQVLEEELATVQTELSNLAHVSPTPVLPELPDFKAVRVSAMIAWAVLLASIAVAGWREYRQPFGAKEFKGAWAAESRPKQPEKAAVAKSAAEEEADVKVSWPYKATGEATKVTLDVTVPATSAQIEYATKHGRELAEPYRPETITSAIVMPVPTANPGEAAVMFFDGRRGELSNEQVYILAYRPIPRTLISVDGRRGVFLDR